MHRKFRLLLDAAFAKKEFFPKLCKKTNVAHVVHDLDLPVQAEDKQIYQTAIGEDRFVLTVNFKHFRSLVKKNQPGIIGIESYLSNSQVDQTVSAFLLSKDPEDYYGKAIKIKTL